MPSTFIDGIGQCQVLDKSSELVDLKGHDISSLAKTGTFTWEHQIGTPATLVGKILKAKKIFSKSECENDRELYYWNKCKTPYLYVMGELLDEYTASAKECAGQMRYSQDNPDKAPLLGFSIEGSEIPNTRKGMVITRSIARKVTLTASPCNSMCVAEIFDNPDQKSQVKDDFDEIFKSKEEAITLFKSDIGEKLYETFLAKNEKTCLLHKSIPWSSGSVKGDSVHYNHPEHGTVSIQKQPTGEFHVKHNGALAGVGGVKGSFGSSKEAGSHAKKYMNAVSQKKILPATVQNHASPNMVGKSESCPKHKKEKELKKAIEAGSYNAAPSTLVNGAAYQSESLAGRQATTGAEDNTFQATKNKDWKKQAKSDYDRWPHKDKFEAFMKARMPHLADGEIRAIGRVLSLKKSIEMEKSLENLIFKSEDPKLGNHFLFSAENPMHPQKNELKMDHKQTLSHLKSKGYNAHEVKGHYGAPETSIMVHGVNPKQAEDLHGIASKLGQDSSIYSNGGKHEMRYHHGENAGKKVHGEGTVWHKDKPKDMYTTMPNGKTFTHNFKF